MPRLVVQIDYTNNVSLNFLSWLEENIPPILYTLGLDTSVTLNENPLLAPSSIFDNSTLYNFTDQLIENSPIRIQAEESGRWFVHVLITTLHENTRLWGIMYDFGFGTDRRHRQGCAIFYNRIKTSVSTDAAGYNRCLLRTIVHEVGHCLNLVHQFDGSLMAQTENVKSLLGPNWIKDFDFLFSPNDKNFVRDFPSTSKPGGSSSRFEDATDTFSERKRDFRVTVKPLTDDPQKRFERGDAVSLLIKITNLTIDEITIPTPVSWNERHCRVWLKSPRSKYRLVFEPIQGCGMNTEHVSVNTNDHRIFTLNLLADNKGYLFNTIGTYKVKIGVKNNQGLLTKSKEVSFFISRPLEGNNVDSSIVYSSQLLKRILLKEYKQDKLQQKVEKAKENHPMAGFTRVMLWGDFYKIKKEIGLSKNRKATAELLLKLQKVCENIYIAETSSIRKGKMVHELFQISTKYKKTDFELSKKQIKSMKLYQNFTDKAITRVKPKPDKQKGSSNIQILVAALIFLLTSCVKDEIKFLGSTQIYGSVKFNHPVRGELLLPSNQMVNIVLNDNLNPFLSFKTSEAGRYSFKPFREGKYTFEFGYSDTLLQYDASLVRREDIDTLKKSSFGVMHFRGKAENVLVDGSYKAYQKDIVLLPEDTGLKLFVTDDQNRPLYGSRVCLYTNQIIAQQNAPFSGGAFAYLSSDINGYVLFTGLQAQTYYINASGKFGVVSLTNQWSSDMKSAKPNKDGEITVKQIILK